MNDIYERQPGETIAHFIDRINYLTIGHRVSEAQGARDAFRARILLGEVLKSLDRIEGRQVTPPNPNATPTL